ncbi:TetR/AcrR family transcriptional regulator [Thermosporothrix hazakensis]|nr:TetR/AcrR family transcriptional regulator [Thermosporothrix hazakensis]
MKSQHEPQKPKSYHHGDLRNALIQAGLDLLAEGGARELDLRKVARRAGVSHAAPYRHFVDKQALIAAITEEGFRLLAEQIQATLRAVPDSPFEQLLGIARVYVHFAQTHPWLMREMFSGLTLERERFVSLQMASKAVYRLYVDVIRRGQEKGTLVDGDPAALAAVLWSMLHGLAMLIIENQMRPYADGPEGIERKTRYAIEILYGGFARK